MAPVTRAGHPRTHGHHINSLTCGQYKHHICHGYSGGYDTYVCGCCCHDLETDPGSVTDADRAWIEQVRSPSPQPSEGKVR
ncbi:hypothetical protein ACFWMR_02010 [Amycolatopsis thailandensis]|uniref:hypothetical protein n=1 Tax=Amycolatopsis thailandensis TaxID=589330 RepID=UPI003653E3B1